jgi:hypothetical protein
VGSLLFFFATTRLRERLASEERLRAVPGAAGYVKHVQELLIHGLAARRPGRAPREGGAS